MKNKRVIVLLSILLLIVAILILSANIFVLKKVNIKIENNTSISTQIQTEICKNKVFKKDQNILFINKSKIISTLEKEYPSIMFISIETKFPNTFLIHAEERREIFYVKLSSSKFVSFDKTFKALNEYSETPSLTQLTGLNVNDVAIGNFVEKSNALSVAKNFYNSMDLCYYANNEFISLVKRVEIEDNNLTVITNYNLNVGTTLKIEKPQNNLTKKIVYALSALNALNSNQRTHGIVLVQEDLEDENILMSSYIE